MEGTAPRLSTSPADDGAWWTAFNDPVLNQLVEQAHAQNMSLQQAGLRILQARAQLGVAVGQLYPQVQESVGSYTRSQSSVNSESAKRLSGLVPVDRDTDLYNVGFDAAWELDIWGRFRRGIDAMNAEVVASIAGYDDVLVSLVAEVAATYIQMRSLEERLRLAQENAQIQTRSYEIAEVRFRHGVVTELDVQQATALLRDTEALLPYLETRVRQARNALSVLLGLPPQNLPDLLGDSRPIPRPPPEVAVGLPADLLRRRPDIRRAERDMAAQSARIGIAQADLYPAFSLVGAFSFSAEDIDNVFEGRSVNGRGGPAVQWALLHYGRLKNNVRAQDARFQELVANYEHTVLRAAQEVEDASVAYLRSQDQAGFLGESVEASKRAVDLALIQYRDGAIDYTRVLDTQAFLVRQQDRLATTRGEVALNLVALYKALGGGWQIRRGRVFVAKEIQQEMRDRTDWGRLLPEIPATAQEDKPWWWPFW